MLHSLLLNIEHSRAEPESIYNFQEFITHIELRAENNIRFGKISVFYAFTRFVLHCTHYFDLEVH